MVTLVKSKTPPLPAVAPTGDAGGLKLYETKGGTKGSRDRRTEKEREGGRRGGEEASVQGGRETRNDVKRKPPGSTASRLRRGFCLGVLVAVLGSTGRVGRATRTFRVVSATYTYTRPPPPHTHTHTVMHRRILLPLVHPGCCCLQRTSRACARPATRGLSESPTRSGQGVSSDPQTGQRQGSEGVDVAAPAAPAAWSFESAGYPQHRVALSIERVVSTPTVGEGTCRWSRR